MAEIMDIDTRDIMPGDNDRTIFDPVELQELADSIKEHGLVQPITVRMLDIPTGDPIYQIVAGERRFRACKLLGFVSVPCIVKDLTEEEAAGIMLSENVARADLDPIDEARAYQKRIDQYGWSVQECADKAGVSSVRVQFRLKLLNLRPDLQNLVRTGNLDLGYARIIADSGMDANFQTLALRLLRENPSPTPAWLRKQVGVLVNQQCQSRLFEDPLFSGQPAFAGTFTASTQDPPHPSTTKPPTFGKSPREVVSHQVEFWNEAAESWDWLGKPFKRQECQSAAQALQSLLFVL